MRRLAAIAVALGLVAHSLAAPAAGGGLTSAPSGIDPRLRLEFEEGRTHRGKPEIRGFVYNDNGRAANNVHLVVETLDDSGQVIDRAPGFVFGIVPVFNRTAFDVPLRTTGASYRVTVTSFDWRDGGPS